jgi:glycosyltransferase involved in cell wall biosynthesis
MRIGTLSRIQGSDEKGVRFALEAVRELQGWGHAARLNIAGKINDRTFYDQVIAPHIGTLAHYTGMLAGQDKSDYLDSLHVGAALSNPGNYDLEKNKFEGEFEEGNSLVLPEMMLHGVIPVSTDSGGAEALVDAGLDDFIVPLKTLEERGHDAFINEVAATMLDAATTPLSRHEISSRVRTADDMGGEYAEYIMKLANPKTIFTAPRRKARFNNLVQLPATGSSGLVNE